MKELFPIESVTKLTPRAEWMKKHNLQLFEGWHEWEDLMGWYCVDPDNDDGFGDPSWGETQDDAILAWAIKNNERLWNENL